MSSNNETPLMMGDTKQMVMTGVVKVKAYIPEFIEVYAGFLEYVEIDRDVAIEHAKHFKITAEDLS